VTPVTGCKSQTAVRCASTNGTGMGAMMLKLISAMIAAAAIAGALVVIPGLSLSVEAKTAKHKGDRLDLTLRMTRCQQMAWPYYDQSCRKEIRRPARIVTTDRM
jgi:hypothetical protein